MTQRHDPGGLTVRDAGEEDAEALAAIVDLPPDVLRNVVHDRTVRVAERASGGEAADPNADVDASGGEAADSEAESEPASVVGFVSFDVRDGFVHVTQFGGSREACERLLAEPIRYAAKEDLGVEVLVVAADEEMRAAAEAVGFEKKGSGPMFEGERTTRYRAFP